MPEDRLFVSFTMDCPGVARGTGYPGPASWPFAKKSMVGFVQALGAAHLKASLFLASDLCKRVGDTVSEFDDSRVELGLLSDPRLEGFKGSLAGYRVDYQKEIISLGVSTFQNVFGREPETFRPGEFSANNDTVIAACELGFRQGSFSLPERDVASACSTWKGAYPFSHHMDPLDVLHPGTLELYDVPVTSDFDRTTLNGQEEFTPLFLGTEQRDIKSNAAFLVSKHIERMTREDIHVKTITCMSTNAANYADPGSRASQMLAHVIDTIKRLADEHHLMLVPATLADIHAEADRLYQEGKLT